jgi:hypothetical protein
MSVHNLAVQIVLSCFLSLVAVKLATASEPLPERFHFPSANTDKTVTTRAEGTDTDRPERWKARMVVDGVQTDARWPEQSPTVYPIGKNLFLLHDGYAELGDYVWNRATKKLTPLGRCYLFNAPGFGLMVERFSEKGKEVEIIDFPDETGRPRVLWHKQHGSSHLPPLGTWDGALVCTLGEKRLLVLEPGREAREIELDLGDFRWQATAGDEIRRGKVLVLGRIPAKKGFGSEFKVAVGVLNLQTKEVKQLGKIKGGWTTTTAIPHATASARWITQAEAKKLSDVKMPAFLGTDGGWAWVIEETEQILQPAQKGTGN